MAAAYTILIIYELLPPDYTIDSLQEINMFKEKLEDYTEEDFLIF